MGQESKHDSQPSGESLVTINYKSLLLLLLLLPLLSLLLRHSRFFFVLFLQWLALRFPKAAIYFDSIRECYEAFAILSFLAYLLSYLNSEYEDFEGVVKSKPQVHHLFPVCCLPNWEMGK